MKSKTAKSIKTVKIPRQMTGAQREAMALHAARAGLFVLAFFCTMGILLVQRPSGMENLEFRVGEPAPRTLFSPFEISFADEQATEALRQTQSRAIPVVFAVDDNISKSITAKTDAFFEIIHKSKVQGKKVQISDLPFEISDASLKYLIDEPVLEDVRKNLELLLHRSLELGMVDYKEKLQLLEQGKNGATMLDRAQKKESQHPIREILTTAEARESALQILPEPAAKNRSMRNAVLEIFNAVILPNLKLDDEELKARQKKAVHDVSDILETVKKDELIVQRGMLITPQDKVRLTQIQKKLAEHKVLNQLFGLGILAIIAYSLCFVYLQLFEKKTFASLRLVTLILTVFLITLASSKIIAVWPGSSHFLMPAALASALLTLLIHPRLGFLAAIMMTVLCAPLAHFEPDSILTVLISSVAACFGAFRLRKRTQFLKLGATVGLSAFYVLFLYRIFQEFPFVESLQTAAMGLANGFLVTTPFCFLLLPILESAFNLTTDITLLELSDLNHPLLKRMIVEAPGTYHHSLVVSTLAESACEAIGANALLARVGAYFHDIGKIPRAEFFTENSTSKNINRHEKMAPAMSCMLIMNHVRDGIELGRQYKLKDRILRFIPEHQGTGVIYYFYRKALDNAAPGETVNPEDFRYPGPKPQSRETAVVMLADSTEAASRSLKEPSPESIRTLVRKIINTKFIDGQMDECDLTLRDLYRIQESFVHNLMAIFHTRITYPLQPAEPGKVNLFEDPLSKFHGHPHEDC